MAPQHVFWKKKPTKDGRNAKQRRADKKRAARLAGEPHLTTVATHLKNKRNNQAQRWVNHNMRTGDILGYQNEIRWGIKSGNTQYMSDEAQSALERLGKERAAALDRLNRAKVAAAGRDAVVEPEVWVDDWWGQTVAGGVAGAGDGTGSGAIFGAGVGAEKQGGDAMEEDTEIEEGKQPEDEDEDKAEDSDCMSGVEMG